MRGVRIALAAGLALMAIAIVVTLLGSPISVAASNTVPSRPEEPLASTTHGSSYCQEHETLPRGTSAIRVWLAAAYGPRVHVTVRSGGHLISGGYGGSGWSGGSVTVPVKPLAHAVSGATVCVSFALRDETVLVIGNRASPAHAGSPAISSRMWIEYMHPGTVSWASLVPSVIRHMGFGRAAPGTWVVYLALALVVAVAALASNAVLRDLS
jgi:hypothetical protein